MEIRTVINSVMSFGGAAASYLWGGWSDALSTLLAFVVIDYLSGFAASAKEGKLSSDVGFWGITRKCFIFLIAAVANKVDVMLGDGHLIRDATVTFYVCNEGLSIIENCIRLGLPVPEVVKRAINLLWDRQEEKIKESDKDE
jgi:toxin secretion/phage lysis holin